MNDDVHAEMIDLVRKVLDVQEIGSTSLMRLSDQVQMLRVMLEAVMQTHPNPEELTKAVRAVLAREPAVQQALERERNAG